MAATVMTIALNEKKRRDGAAAPDAASVQREADRQAAEKEAKLIKEQNDAAAYAKANPCKHGFNRVLEMLNSTALQTVLYVVFVLIFQSLTNCLRKPEEFYVDKLVMDRILDNYFDSSHNDFHTVRRIADVYEWGNTVLWPGLFSDAQRCSTDFTGAIDAPACNDETWPDGDGSFHVGGATAFSIADAVNLMDQFDWTDGLLVKQVRQSGAVCTGDMPTISGMCYPAYEFGMGDTQSYGYNFTNPSDPMSRPFIYTSIADAGTVPDGFSSAAIPSFKWYEGGGFMAVVLPFFSDTYLPTEEGPAGSITDFRLTAVTTTNGKTPRYMCVRTSMNGAYVRQMCDPGTDGEGAGLLTGAVRREVEKWWNDLKRAHYLDHQTRMLSMTLQLRSNTMGVRYRMTLMFEFTSTGAILPSYDIETRVMDATSERDMVIYANIALVMVIFFTLLEGVELAKLGATEYFSDMWNVMDWANYIVFYIVYYQVMLCAALVESAPRCDSPLCTNVGYYDDWELMREARSAKTFLSLCVCIQLFKVLKFASALIPKFGLATNVLRVCAMDLLFFGITFIISMMAFSMMLYVQLGPVMEGYWNQVPALISLTRALFGDFDIDAIISNSNSYFNCILFLGYLFVAVFVMLSMFLAILAEAQVAVREMETANKEENPDFKDYGVISDGIELSTKFVKRAYHTVKPIDPTVVSPVDEESKADVEPQAELVSDVAGPADVTTALIVQEAASAPPSTPVGGGAGGGVSSAKLDELMQAVDTIGGMLIQLTSRFDGQEAAMAELQAEVAQMTAVAQQSHAGVVAFAQQTSEHMDEVREGLGVAALQGDASAREISMRMQASRGRATFRQMRGGGTARALPL